MKGLYLLTILVIALFLGSCDDLNHENAAISIRLTDAPADYREVWVDIQGIDLLYESTDGTDQVLNLQNIHTGQYNLLDYQNGKDVLLITTDIPPGRVAQIRLVLGSGCRLVTNSETFHLVIPSGENSGLKIDLHETIENESKTDVYLDFDANKSIVELGNGNFQLKPVIRAYLGGYTGAIEGTVLPNRANATVRVQVGTDEYEAICNPDGYFCISGILPGTYSVAIEPVLPYIGKELENVKVVAGEKTNLGGIQLVKQESFIASSLQGDLNIEPSTEDGKRFEMITPTGLIDIETLTTNGDVYAYNGLATEINLMPKAQGCTIVIGGAEIELDKNQRYTFTSLDALLSVDLRNVKNGNGHWWIQITGEKIKIFPSPVTTE